MKPLENRWLSTLIACLLCTAQAPAEIHDRIIFGDAASESAHLLTPGRSERITGGLDAPARRLLPPETENWEGRRIAFRLKVDPAHENYVTIRLWGDEVNPNRLVLYVENKQIGYLHLGDIEILDFGTPEPPYNDRFYYNTAVSPGEFVRRVRGATHKGIYGLGLWREELDEKKNAVLLSSPSWTGTYPWLDRKNNIYGIFLTHIDTTAPNPEHFSGFYASPVLALMARRTINPATHK